MTEGTRRRRSWNRSGQGLIEYVLITALVAVGLILVLSVFRNQIGNTVDSASTSLQSGSGGPSYYVPGGGSAGSTGRGSGGPGGQIGGRGTGGGNGRGGGNGPGGGQGNGN